MKFVIVSSKHNFMTICVSCNKIIDSKKEIIWETYLVNLTNIGVILVKKRG